MFSGGGVVILRNVVADNTDVVVRAAELTKFPIFECVRNGYVVVRDADGRMRPIPPVSAVVNQPLPGEVINSFENIDSFCEYISNIFEVDGICFSKFRLAKFRDFAKGYDGRILIMVGERVEFCLKTEEFMVVV